MDRCITKVRVRPDGAESFIKGVETLQVPTKQEKGCLSHELYRSSEDPCVFYFVEHWETEADFLNHLETPHVAEFDKLSRELTVGQIEPLKWYKVL